MFYIYVIILGFILIAPSIFLIWAVYDYENAFSFLDSIIELSKKISKYFATHTF